MSLGQVKSKKLFLEAIIKYLRQALFQTSFHVIKSTTQKAQFLFLWKHLLLLTKSSFQEEY